MRTLPSRGRPGFTLVELLTVIAIIVLLISILIPAISAARTQAKKSATAGVIKSVGGGCEMFKSEFGHYPQSRGLNPFENPGDDVKLMGAQWLTLQLGGADGRGFVDPTIKNDSNGDRQITSEDWLDWYKLTPSREYTRLGPYADVDSKNRRNPEQYVINDPSLESIPAALLSPRVHPDGTGGTSDWNNGRIPFFVDAFGYPILYYRANPKVNAPFTTGTPGGGNFKVGRYDQADNGYFTGSDGNNGRFPINFPQGWDISISGVNHKLAMLGYDPSNPTQWPQAQTFADFVYDGAIFESTATSAGGRVWPHNADSFLLIASGEDGIYGNGNDITNFASE